MRNFIIWLFLFFAIVPLYGQSKIEIEKRIRPDNVPRKALKAIEKVLEKSVKLKWYYEQDGAHRSYECKFKYNRYKYSIEFDTLGQLEDAEILIGSSQLPTSVVQSLHRNFNKLKIRRAQIQFLKFYEKLLDAQFLKTALQSKEAQFEIEISSSGRLFEILIDSDGLILAKRVMMSPHGWILEF